MKHRSVFFNAVTFILVAALVFGAGLIVPGSALAGPPMRGQAHMSLHGGGHGHGGGGHGGGHHGGAHNTNVNVHVDNHGGGHHHDDHHGGGHHHDDHHHDIVGDIVAGAITGIAVGAIVSAASMPTGCTDVVINGIAYRQCGPTWYQPYYQGTAVQYMVVNPPR